MKKTTTWIIIALIIVSFLLWRENQAYSNKIDSLNSEIEELGIECDQQYDKGYKDGQDAEKLEGATYHDSPYYEIEDMSDDDIIEYLEERFDDTVWAGQDACNFAVYAFQQGYISHKKGIWNEVIEELLNGYVFTESDIAKFSQLFK